MSLIIHADDFGMTRSINDAIIELCKLGTLSSTSIMANMPFSSEATELISIPNISLGLHSTFTQGKPISLSKEIPTLCNHEGSFYNYQELVKRAQSGKIDILDIIKELRAQYLFVKEIIGDKLIFIDAHHSIQNKLKPFHKAFIEVGKEFNIPIIRTRQQVFLKDLKNEIKLMHPSFFNVKSMGVKRVITNYYYQSVARQFSKTFSIADGQLSVFKNDEKRLFELVRKLIIQNKFDNKTYYVVSHPATNTSDLKDTNLTEERVLEYNYLKSDAFKKAVLKNPLNNFSKLL